MHTFKKINIMMQDGHENKLHGYDAWNLDHKYYILEMIIEVGGWKERRGGKSTQTLMDNYYSGGISTPWFTG